MTHTPHQGHANQPTDFDLPSVGRDVPIGAELVAQIGPPVHGGTCLTHLGLGRFPSGRGGRSRGMNTGESPYPPIFVRHGAPGEVARIRITGGKAKAWFGDAISIERPHPRRVPHIWPEAGPGGVGGAELGHLELAAQREFKSAVLWDAMRRLGSTTLVNQAIDAMASNITKGVDIAKRQPVIVSALDDGDGRGTRTRVTLSFDSHGRAGMFRANTRDIIPISEMPLGDPALSELGLWSHPHPEWAGRRITAVAPSMGSPVIAQRGMTVRERVTVGHDSWTYQVASTGFWQVHPAAPARLIASVLSHVTPRLANGRTRVVELYAGSGLFTLPLAERISDYGGALRTFEGSKVAVECARRNVQGFNFVDIRRADIDPALIRRYLKVCDVVVADPPRTGLGPLSSFELARSNAELIVLISCDPASFARDAGHMISAGRKLVAIEAWDLFPHTHHFETIGVFERRR